MATKSKSGGLRKRQHPTKSLRQRDRTARNKKKAWKKHIKKYPNDLVAKINIERLMGKAL